MPFWLIHILLCHGFSARNVFLADIYPIAAASLNLQFNINNLFKKLKTPAPYLVEACERIVFTLLRRASPVMEYGSVFACRIREGHPLPGTHLFTTQLGLDGPVALSCIARQQRRRISRQTQCDNKEE